MKGIVATLILAAGINQAAAAPKALPKDCSKEFVKVWERRSFLKKLPEPNAPCVIHMDTGILVCDERGCVRP